MTQLYIADGEYVSEVEGPGTVIVQESTVSALTASAIPIKPPSDWFADPGLDGLSPLTVQSDGRVFGHIAAWHTSHIGMAGGIKPPKSRSNYAFFRTGVVETDTGDMVNVGAITLAGGHAPLNASVDQTVKHYDDTNTAIMDVAAGEDRHGIWVAGALRPSVTDEQIRTIRASSVSGDWRPINGRMELVAVCAVNCPGFPIPRAQVASGAPIALIAAGIEPIYEAAQRHRMDEEIEAAVTAGLGLFHERVRNLEALTASTQADQLRSRVHSSARVAVTASANPVIADKHRDRTAQAEQALVASIRSRVKQPEIEALRERVKGSSAPLV